MTWILVAITGLAILFGLYVVRNMFLPTRGNRIRDYPTPTKALLVLDIQESSNRAIRPFPTGTTLGNMIEVVNRLIECLDNAGMEVAYIRQVFSNNLISRMHGGRSLGGQTEPRICSWICVVNSNNFAKNRTDAFSNRQLERFLIDRQVTELFLVGLDAAFCVYYTALGALNRGYKVTVVTDAVMTGRNMTHLIERYRRKGIAVMESQEVLQAIGTGKHKENE